MPGRGSVGGVSTDSDSESRCRWSLGKVPGNRENLANLLRRLPAQPTGQVECEVQLEMVAFEKARCAMERKEIDHW